MKSSPLFSGASEPHTSSTTGHKRKRSHSLHVRFCLEEPSVAFTYSEAEYDRGGLFSDPPALISPPVIVTLAVHVVSTANFAMPSKKTKRQLPKLKIDTSCIQGPLYLTDLTTNHQKRLKSPIKSEEDSEIEVDRITKQNTHRNSQLVC